MSIPKFIPKLDPTFALAGAAWSSCSAGSSGASSGTDDTKVVLDRAVRGAWRRRPYSTPYSITRCQFAHANKGFETEQAVCEGLADGEFILALGANHMNRASWGCSPTSPPA